MNNRIKATYLTALFVMSQFIFGSVFAQSSTSKTEMQWLGQAGFKIKTPGGKVLVIDPWITGGPKAPPAYKNDLSAMGKVDFLLVTHGTLII